MTTRRSIAVVITCEHAGNHIPARYRPCFADQREALQGHQGYDRGALTMARELARKFDAPLFYSTVSRLLVDLNRSPGHRQLHTAAIQRLPVATRQEICATYYAPVRSETEQAIGMAVARRRVVVHVSSHSFTPILNGIVRNADVGLLYDPIRPGEVALCRAWQAQLAQREPGLHVRCNYPYAGKSDGFTAYLRRRFSEHDYIGIELEINQRIVQQRGSAWPRLRQALVAGLAAALRAASSRP